jgi:acetoacetate decarboxylase
VTVEWRTDEDAVLDILPPDLGLGGPATAFVVLENNHRSTFGSFGELFTGVQCIWNGEPCTYLVAGYSTSETAQIVNREIWGFGQKRAQRIEVIAHEDGEVEAVMDVQPDDQAVRAAMRPAKKEAAEAAGGIPIIFVRVVPDAAGDPPVLAQLVALEYTNHPIVGSDGAVEDYVGTGNLQFGSASDAALPIVELLSFRYNRVSTEVHRGKVLKTY